MAKIAVKVVNNSKQTVGLLVEEGGEWHEYLKVMQRRGDIKSVAKVAPAAKGGDAGAVGGGK